MRWLLATLIVFFIALQYRLWFGEGSLAQQVTLERAVEQQRAVNAEVEARNEGIAREVRALKNGTEAIEERARNDLGMIKQGETFYMVIEKERQP